MVARTTSTRSVPQAAGLRFALVVSTYHAHITSRLESGAREVLGVAGVADAYIERIAVPGAFELPFAARVAADSGRIDGIVCLGCLVKGETPHFDFIASSVAHGIMQVSQATGVPVAFGVLTTNSLDEAEARVQPGPDNKGFEATHAAVEMAVLARDWRRRPPPPGVRV